VIGTGATGFIAGGPVGAVALGIGAGAAMDGVYSVATNTPQGYIDEKLKLVDNPPAGKFSLSSIFFLDRFCCRRLF